MCVCVSHLHVLGSASDAGPFPGPQLCRRKGESGRMAGRSRADRAGTSVTRSFRSDSSTSAGAAPSACHDSVELQLARASEGSEGWVLGASSLEGGVRGTSLVPSTAGANTSAYNTRAEQSELGTG